MRACLQKVEEIQRTIGDFQLEVDLGLKGLDKHLGKGTPMAKAMPAVLRQQLAEEVESYDVPQTASGSTSSSRTELVYRKPSTRFYIARTGSCVHADKVCPHIAHRDISVLWGCQTCASHWRDLPQP